jgi:hypothetical protein
MKSGVILRIEQASCSAVYKQTSKLADAKILYKFGGTGVYPVKP